MWRYLIFLALAAPTLCNVFDFTEFDDPLSTVGRVANAQTRGSNTESRQHPYIRNVLQGVCNITTGGVTSFGMCRSSLNCTLDGGTYSGAGSCALGQCCIYSGSCGTTTYKKVSYFTFTSTATTLSTAQCTYTVNSYNINICQIRLDFDMFSIAVPRQLPGAATSAISCRDDSFSVTTSNNAKIPTICGYNTGQHMYIPMNVSFGETSTTLVMNLATRPSTTTGVSLSNPGWRIRVFQLECPYKPKYRGSNAEKDFLALAPAGCLQYYTSRTGTISNFGWNPSNTLANNLYIANMDYSMCFYRSPSTCGMKITPVSFSLDATSATCANDFLFMPEAFLTSAAGVATAQPNSKFCVLQLAAGTFAQNSGRYPAYLHFLTDNIGSTVENGFQLNYEIPPASGC